MQARRPYTPLTEPISVADANAEPPEEQLFKPTRHYPAKLYTIDAMDSDGYVVHFEWADISIEQFEAKKAQLKAMGYLPTSKAARASVEAEKQRGAPVCEYHGAMRESTKRPGTFFCSAKMGDGSYCKSKG